MTIPYWFEDNITVMNVTNGEFVPDVNNRYSQGDIDKVRAWWNTNLVMEDYMPIFIPFFTSREITYKIFAERVIQRNTTHDLPMRPTLLLQNGIIELTDNIASSIFVVLPANADDSFVTEISLEDGSGTFFQADGKKLKLGQEWQKRTDKRYWNGFQYL